MQSKVQKEIGGHKWRNKKKPKSDEDLDLSVGKNPLNKYVDEKDVEGVQDVKDVQTVVGSEDDQSQFDQNEYNQAQFEENEDNQTEFGQNEVDQTQFGENENITPQTEDAEVLTSEDDGFVGQEDQEMTEQEDMLEEE